MHVKKFKCAASKKLEDQDLGYATRKSSNTWMQNIACIYIALILLGLQLKRARRCSFKRPGAWRCKRHETCSCNRAGCKQLQESSGMLMQNN